MNEHSTLLESLVSHSVRFNNLLIPIGAVERTAARYTHQLFAMTDDERFPISLVGSCVAVRYRGHFLTLCTRHQLNGWDMDRIALIAKDGSVTITSGGVRHYQHLLNETEVHDLVVFDFTEPYKELSGWTERFFDLRASPLDSLSNHIVCLVASGYPFSEQNYDLEEARHLGQAKRIFLCRPDGPNQPSDESLMRLKTIEPLGFDPDGLSGGGVFVVQMVDTEPQAFFAGIITRANDNYIHIVKAGFILKFLDTWIDRRAT